ncbi:MAG: beta-propeller fold lactonase family protein [bacterium]|nr:beta-propeller fold lactonase family protein [bacterium]
MNKQLKIIFLFLGLFLLSSAVCVAESTTGSERFYIGAAACRKCHYGTGKKNPFNVWSLSKHASGYAVLGKPESIEIARLSGIDVNPFDSPVCLKCHTTASDVEAWRRDEVFLLEDGVQCEYCHGPGSEYSDAAVMADRKAAMKAGLQMPGEDFCLICHMPKGSHDTVMKTRVFDYDTFLGEIAHHGKARPYNDKINPGLERKRKVIRNAANTDTAAVTYKTPFNLALSPDGKRLYVACESSDSLVVVDTGKRTVLKEITVQNQPHGVCTSDDGQRIYVSNRGSDTVSVIDAHLYKILNTIAVGDEPHGLVTSKDDNTLYVANAGSNDIAVIDLKTGREAKRLSAGRGTWDVARSPDDGSVFITNNLSHYVKFREPPLSEVTVIDTGRSMVEHRFMLPEANLVQGIDFSPDGEFALVTLNRTKNLIPITRVLQGWVITNGFGVLWKDGHVDQLLLDEVDNFFSDPTDVVITPGGKYAYVSGGGIDSVAVINLEKMKHVLGRADEKKRREYLPNHLGIATEYVVKRIAVGRSPRGLTASADGRFVYVADGLDDTVSVIDTAKQERIGVIDLGGPKEITLARRGERIFHSAEITFGRQFSCHTCHPDGSVDGLTYDIEPDGLGINPVDNRTLRGILDTAPFKWTGKNKTLSRQCGPRLAIFFTRIDPFTPEQVTALERYICTIPRNPNRYRKGTELTPAQRRGKQLFERTHDNSGKEIPKESRCNVCHSGPYFTNRRIVDVGTRSPLDTQGKFDVPHLNNIYESPPYLHDGRSNTLEEIWTRFNPDDKHGVTNDMTKDQLNDLIEYLKTL